VVAGGGVGLTGRQVADPEGFRGQHLHNAPYFGLQLVVWIQIYAKGPSLFYTMPLGFGRTETDHPTNSAPDLSFFLFKKNTAVALSYFKIGSKGYNLKITQI
jgi:hypothetical protein